MARRTTSKKGPSTTGKDTAGSDTSRALDPNEIAGSDSLEGASSAESTPQAPPDSSGTITGPDKHVPLPESEVAIATADESQLAKDISAPAGDAVSSDPVSQPTAPQASAGSGEAGAETAGDAARDDVSVTDADALQTEPVAEANVADTGHEAKTSEPENIVPSAPAAAASEPRSGLFPMLIGGVLAGAIGYAAAYLNAPQGADPDEIAQLRSELSGVRAELDAVTAPVEISALEAQIASLRDQLDSLPPPSDTGSSATIDAELAELRAQLGADGEIDLAPLQARLDEFSESLSQQADSIADELGSLRAAVADAEDQIAALGADVADLRDLSERRVSDAEAAVDAALAQSGLDSMRAALETGVPYTDAVARLENAGVSVPEALSTPAATGIPTIEALQESFPEAARAGLREALQDAPTESTADRIGNFLRAQTGARSTAPRAGDDPDAVLSRVGAAVEAGDIAAALAESEALPASAQAAMGDWLGAARARLAASNALPEFSNTISTE